MTRFLVVLAALAGASLVTAGCDCGGTTARTRDGGGGDLDGAGTDGGGGGDDGGGEPDAGPPPAEIVVIGPGAPADAADRFGDPPAATAGPTILYPLDDVLIPRNVSSPDVQWEPEGASGDLYRVRFSGTPTTLTAYVGHSGAAFEHDYLVEQAAWRTLATADAGTTMTLTVDRWSAGAVYAGPSVRVRVARGSIAGSVYYWTLGSFSGTEGRIVRVRQGTGAAPVIENFMPEPTISPDGERCAACHGLSRNGNLLAVALDDGTFGGVYDLTEDLTGADPPMVFRFDSSWFYAAFNDTGSRLLMTDASQNTFLLDGTTGARITPPSGALPTATHPAWSPDGSTVALVVGANDAWELSTGNIATLPVLGGDSFGALSMLHSGAALAGEAEGGTMDAYPTYSPDSTLLAFQHGTRTLATDPAATGALYAIPAGGGAAVRLSNAHAGSAWYPNFTPFRTPDDAGDDVFWVLFYSREDYGNELAGTRGTGRRQIWVAAVSADISGGGDPSFVPYWLPGQESEEENASAYWAPVACRVDGEGCLTSGQCCSGRCGGSGSMTCMPPPACRREGETCSSAADCCEAGATCEAGVCLAAPF